MAVSIFWRLMAGYLVILICSTVLSLYSIVQLGKLSNTARTALNVDNQMIAYEEKLVDAILSEVRYGKKYIITHASALYDQSREFNREFVSYLSELNELAESPDIKTRLVRVREFHVRYGGLFNQEVQYLKARQMYAESRYRQEKEKAVERILGELQHLKGELQQSVLGKLETIERAARLTRRLALLMTLIFLALSTALSFVISKNVTKAIADQKRTMEDATDNPRASSRFLDVQELVDAWSDARRKLYDAGCSSWNKMATSWDAMKGSLYALRYGKEKK